LDPLRPSSAITTPYKLFADPLAFMPRCKEEERSKDDHTSLKSTGLLTLAKPMFSASTPFDGISFLSIKKYAPPPDPKKSAEKTHLVTGGNICLMLEQFEQQQQAHPAIRFGV
jgi:hypothetical protein